MAYKPCGFSKKLILVAAQPGDHFDTRLFIARQLHVHGQVAAAREQIHQVAARITRKITDREANVIVVEINKYAWLRNVIPRSPDCSCVESLFGTIARERTRFILLM